MLSERNAQTAAGIVRNAAKVIGKPTIANIIGGASNANNVARLSNPVNTPGIAPTTERITP
jgi:hypothetical protein